MKNTHNPSVYADYAVPLAQEPKNSCCWSETFGHIEKNIPSWRKNLGFYGKTEHFKDAFVSVADKIYPQTQKNAKLWVWGVYISNIRENLEQNFHIFTGIFLILGLREYCAPYMPKPHAILWSFPYCDI